jgi:hypothetical protein
MARRQLGDMTQRLLARLAARDRDGEQFAAERHFEPLHIRFVTELFTGSQLN